MEYYGRYCRQELYPLLARINYYLVRWLRTTRSGTTLRQVRSLTARIA
jgi:hypothetical protein